MKQPLISVITIVRNGEDFVEKTLKSVSEQCFDNYEYIVIDGNSQDGTVNIIKKYSSEIDCFISEADEGIADAFNKGIALARGQWVNFMNAGDIFAEKTTLSDCAQKLKTLSADYLLMTGFAVNQSANFIYPIVKLKNSMHVYDKSRQAHQSSFFHKSLFDKYGGFSTDVSITMDMDFFMRVLRYEKFFFYEKQICIFDVSGVSSQYFKTALETIYVQYKNRSGFLDICFIPFFAVLFLLRKSRKKLSDFFLKYNSSREESK